jgi:nitrous oxidase accessory protein NosD
MVNRLMDLARPDEGARGEDEREDFGVSHRVLKAVEEILFMRWMTAGRSARGQVMTTLAILAASCGSALAKTVDLTDATNGLAAAIAEAGPGGTVQIRGVIRETQSIEIPYKVFLRGLNVSRQQPTLIVKPTDNLNALVVLGADVEISNLNIRPSSVLEGNLGTAVFVLGKGFRFSGNTVSGWRVGLFFSGADPVVVGKNTFEGSPLNRDPDWAGAGIFAQFSVGRSEIPSNTFRGYYVGIYVQDSTGFQVNGSQMEKNDIGIWMDGAMQSGVVGNTIAGSAIAAILLTEGAAKNEVRSNGISASGGDSIVAEAGTSGNNLRYNRTDKPIKNFGTNIVADNLRS